MNEVFQIDQRDNVATALRELDSRIISVGGDTTFPQIEVMEPIPMGHKISLYDIPEGSEIIKYGVIIGVATKDIKKGHWVHLHVMKSCYDERSSHLDITTGAPKNIVYE